MNFKDVMHIISLAISLAGAVWFISMRIQKIQGELKSILTKIDINSQHQADFNVTVKEALSDARDGRAELWKETNKMRERVTVIETIQENVS